MPDSYDLLLAGATVVNQDGAVVRDIGVREGKIVAIGSISPNSAREVWQCAGLHVLPGVIDTQVHFREPGMTHKEDLESGSRSAVMGGVTAVFEMPNTEPLTIDDHAFSDKIGRAIGRMHCDFAFFIGGTADNWSRVAEYEQLPGCAGIKVFMGSSTGKLLIPDDNGLRAILENIRRRASFHAEDEPRLNDRKLLRVENDPRSHPVWRDPVAALLATTRLVTLAREAGKRVHVLHVSTAEEIDFLGQHKDVATVEVTPHHLTLVGPECYERLGTRAQMNPPVRDARHRDAIWRGIADGTVDILGSDHAPHTLEEKSKAYPASPSGMTGVQTLVPIMLDHVNAGRLSLARFVDLSSHGPARVFGIANKGRIAVGYDADFTIVDLKRRETITNQWVASKAGWTPYDGVSVTGWPVGTVVRGAIVMRDGQLLKKGQGQPVQFLEALPSGT
ncbi:MAG TPA: dihydroorotase [Xanthobacteraceae bacterium]|nr:dihydroorotase [Xanthobacteraceae bacterium]